jgi:hypothetical protein
MAIKEKPLLFTVPMVRSLLAGIKTQTRRKSTRAEVGQIIWVKEPFVFDLPGDPRPVSYKADFLLPSGDRSPPIKWKSSLYMPRSVSRIQLLVTGFRSERLHDISEGEAILEGLNCVREKSPIYKFGVGEKDLGQIEDIPIYKFGIGDNDFGRPGTKHLGWAWEEWEPCPIAAYRKLWDSINGKDPKYCWDANPLINVINFEVLELTK